jgi:hypothetical protein
MRSMERAAAAIVPSRAASPAPCDPIAIRREVDRKTSRNRELLRAAARYLPNSALLAQ